MKTSFGIFLSLFFATVLTTGCSGAGTGSGDVSDSMLPAFMADEMLAAGEKTSVKIKTGRNVDPGFASYLSSVLQDRISERADVDFNGPDAQLELVLKLDKTLGEECYEIGKRKNKVIIAGGSNAGLLYGAGRFLHTSGYRDMKFYPSVWQGRSCPTSGIRGVYCATHFFNWYQVAPAAEIEKYVEDLALWGINSLNVVYPVINLYGFEDPETEKAFGQMDVIFAAAKRAGMKIGFMLPANADFKNPNLEVAAVPNPDPAGRRGNHGHNICPAKPGGTEYILKNIGALYERMAAHKPDLLCFWPYDEGGCGCPECHPWGVKGYLPLCEKIAELARTYNPATTTILSTWMYDTPEEGEWQALTDYFAKNKGEWIDCIMADAHEDFPRYPLENPVPGDRPLINFPEISMWGLGPWGGYGASPLPERFDRLWRQVKDKVSGGFPYSEGIYEDINKVVISQFYWDKDARLSNSLAMYIGYEYDFTCYDLIMEVIGAIEQNHTSAAVSGRFDAELSLRAWETAQEVDSMLSAARKSAWRWRILHIRAELDAIRYRLTAEGAGDVAAALNRDERAVAAMRELIGIFHCKETDDGTYEQHSWVRPPLF